MLGRMKEEDTLSFSLMLAFKEEKEAELDSLPCLNRHLVE